MTLRTVLLSLQALLAAAEPDDPQDAIVARQFKQFHQVYTSTAQHWTAIFAGGTTPCLLIIILHPNKVARLFS